MRILHSSGISIHAPAKGATISEFQQARDSGNFNPRSREGSDTSFVMLTCILLRFQSTLPRRERHFAVMFWVFWSGFQSTLPRRERHLAFGLPPQSKIISIHAPAKGATCPKPRLMRCPIYFNPRSREGSDAISQLTTMVEELFQSTLPRRERRRTVWHRFRPAKFQSTLPRRERPHRSAHS